MDYRSGMFDKLVEMIAGELKKKKKTPTNGFTCKDKYQVDS
jgi:hypothetical protein